MQCGRPGFDPWVGKIPWRRERLPTPVFWPGEFHGLYNPWGCKELDMTERLSLHFTMDQEGFPCASVVKNLPANAGDTSSIPGRGRSPGEGSSILEYILAWKNFMDRGTWQAIGVAKESDMTEQLKNKNKQLLISKGFCVSPWAQYPGHLLSDVVGERRVVCFSIFSVSSSGHPSTCLTSYLLTTHCGSA